MRIMKSIESAIKQGDIPSLADLTTRNFFGPIQAIIPWASYVWQRR